MSKVRVEYTATKVISKPVKVEFYLKDGTPVFFKALKTIPKPVRIEFYGGGVLNK